MRHARRCLTLSALAISAGGFAAGCASGTSAWNVGKAFGTAGYADGTEMVDDQWVAAAGATGRKGRPVEKSNDPLNLREIFMSEKARSIERNVGIE